jgi:hypothetical protein
LRRPAMPYTTQVNTREEMIWKGVVAATWGGGGGGGGAGGGGGGGARAAAQQAVCVRQAGVVILEVRRNGCCDSHAY